MHERRQYRCAVSARPSVRPSRLCILSKRKKLILNFFSCTILVFPYRTLWQYSDGTPPPQRKRRMQVGYRQKSQFSTNIWLNCVLSTVRLPTVIHTAAPDRGKFVTLIASKRRRLLFAGRRRRSVYHKKPQRYVRDNRTAFNCTHVW